MIIHKCDKCGKLEPQKKGTENRCIPQDWFSLRFSEVQYGHSTVRYDLCGECRMVLKIPLGSDASGKYVGEQLIELIGELVAEEVQNCQP